MVSITGLVVRGRLGAGTAASSLTEHTELSKPKQSGARRFLLASDAGVEVVDDAADDAATEEAFEAFRVVDDCRERFPHAWGFCGFRDVIAFDILLFVEETPEAASDCVGLLRILISPLYFFFKSLTCWEIFSSVVFS